MELGGHPPHDLTIVPTVSGGSEISKQYSTRTGGVARPSGRSGHSASKSDASTAKARRQSVEVTLAQWQENRQKQEDTFKRFKSLFGTFDSGSPEDEYPSERTMVTCTAVDFRSLQAFAKRIVRHDGFDTIIGIVVLANSICIALEQQFKLESIEAPTLLVLEDVFLSIYLTELILRLFAGGLQQLRDRALLFDILLVVISVIDQWIIDASGLEEGLQPMVVMRIARLARLARSIRLIMLFRDLWKLVQGLLSSAGIMFYTFFLICLIVFAFALVGVELIAVPNLKDPSPDPVIDGIIQEYFSNLWLTMLTLTQFVTLDSVGPIYRPLVVNDPFLAVYFLSALLVIGIVLMNLITAVLVNGAMENAEQNKEATRMFQNKKKKKMLKELTEFFYAIDENGSGKIDLEEVLGSSEEIAGFIRHNIRMTDLQDVFNFLDLNGDGELDIDEFCEGLYEAMTSQTPVELKRIDKRVEGLRGHVIELLATQADILQQLAEVSDNLRKDTGSTTPGATIPCTCDEELQSLASQFSAQNQGSTGIAVEPPHVNPPATDTPAWGQQILLELSVLKKQVAKPLAMNSEQTLSLDFDLGATVCSKSDVDADAAEAPAFIPRTSLEPVSCLSSYFISADLPRSALEPLSCSSSCTTSTDNANVCPPLIPRWPPQGEATRFFLV